MPKHPIVEYDYSNHGLQRHDMFQGCGVAFTRFETVGLGAMPTLREAIKDATNALAEQDYDPDRLDEIEREIITHIETEYPGDLDLDLLEGEDDERLVYFSIRVR